MNQRIRFQAAAPSRLYWSGHPAMRIVQALYWLKDGLSSDRQRILRKLRALLADPAHGAALRNDLHEGLRHWCPVISRIAATGCRRRFRRYWGRHRKQQ
jgi:hypothetical protein